MSRRISLRDLVDQNRDKILLCDAEHPMPVFFAEQPWFCRAVLDKTAILVSVSDERDRHPVRLENVMVDINVVQWRAPVERKAHKHDGADPANTRKPHGTWYPQTSTAGKIDPDQRAKSDARARKNQEEVEVAKARELDATLTRSRAQVPMFQLTGGADAGVADSAARIVTDSEPPKESAMPDVLKHCPGCKQEKPKSEFPSGKGFFYCNACRSAHGVAAPRPYAPEAAAATPGRRGRREDGTIVPAAAGMKFCPHCETEKPIAEFGLNKTKADGHQSVCKACRSTIWTAGSTALGHVRAAKQGDAAAQLKVLLGSVRKKLADLEEENGRLKQDLASVNSQLEELLAT